MSTEQLSSINDVKGFVDGSKKVTFAILENKQERYAWIQATLIKFCYLKLGKCEKGIIREYIKKMTDYSGAQITRLIQEYKKTGRITYKHCSSNGFPKKYTQQDVLALVKIDELHGTLNGAATKKLCERAWLIFNDAKYERLSAISISHLYNMRASTGYKRQRVILKKTKPVNINIGKRKKPQPNGAPGYLRIDTVHQGDYEKQKGVYHINAVDEITQFEIVCTIESISEKYLKPILEYVLSAFPFKILGFHSDNGSEYVNHTVARMLNKLFVSFTKSRARKSTDNGLVESKNGSIIRKTFGYKHIPKKFANMINVFNKTHLNYYLNYHRPCLFASTKMNNKGKQIKKYDYCDVLTPYEKFKSLPLAEQYLKEGVTFDELEYKAHMMSDGEAAKQMNNALQKLFRQIFNNEQKILVDQLEKTV